MDGPPEDRHGRPLHDLRISVIDQCNFRCTYCMPRDQFGADHSFLRREELLTFDEIERVASAFISLGVRKVRVSGVNRCCAKTWSILLRDWRRCVRRPARRLIWP